MGVSTPWTGFLHFYIKEEVGFVGGYLMCQRPERAFFISTIYRDLLQRLKKYWCQRPEWAFFISTLSIVSVTCSSRCVNALNGLSSFLLHDTFYCTCRRIGVSTPWTGFLHFYKTIVRRKTVWLVEVSTPWTGFLHFYLFITLFITLAILCVNALNGLSSFLLGIK